MAVISYPYGQRSPRQHPKRRKIVALCLLLVLLCIPFSVTYGQTAPDTKYGLTTGISSTNWHRQASLGFIVKHSEHFMTFFALDVGGGLTASQGQPAVIFPLGTDVRVGFMIGPEVAVYQESPSIDDKLTYLNTATGAFIWTDLTDRLSFMAVGEYIDSSADLSRLKLALKLSIWLNE